jgi:hypothetical protein
MQRRPHPSPYYGYDIEVCKAMILDEAEKLYTNMVKSMVCELINEIVAKKSETASLPVLPFEDKGSQTGTAGADPGISRGSNPNSC